MIDTVLSPVVETAVAVHEAGRPLVSIIIVNTNELHHLRRCLPTIMCQRYSPSEVIVVDNASTDGSREWISLEFPEVRIVSSQVNLGYAGGNNAGFRDSRGEFVAVLNPDTEVDPDWLLELIGALNADPTAGLATPKILQMDRPQLVNACGNDVTFAGLTFCRGLDEPSVRYCGSRYVSSISGAAFVIRRAVLDRIGPFDASYFTYFEDTELSLRAQLAGYACLYVSQAVVLHKYRYTASGTKCYYQERNRYITLLRVFRWKTLLLLAPALVLSEVIVWGYLVLCAPHAMGGKIASYFGVLLALPRTISERRRLQALRRVPDRKILHEFSASLLLAQTTTPGLQRIASTFFNPLLALCGSFVKVFVRW